MQTEMYAGLSKTSAGGEINSETFPAIVSSQLFAAVRQRRAAEKGLRTRGNNLPHLLSGTLHCAGCGKKLQAFAYYADKRHGGRRTGTKWICATTGCRNNRAFQMSERIWDELIESFFARCRVDECYNERAANLRLRLSMIDENIAALELKLAKGQMDANRFERVVQLADEERAKVAAELKAMPPTTDFREVDWQDMGFDERRTLLQRMIRRVDVYSGCAVVKLATLSGTPHPERFDLEFPLMHRKTQNSNVNVNCLTPRQLMEHQASSVIVWLNGMPFYANDVCVDWSDHIDAKFFYANPEEPKRVAKLMMSRQTQVAASDCENGVLGQTR